MSELLKNQDAPAEGLAQPLYVPIKRRSFFMYAGATAGATALVLSGCSDDDDNVNPGNSNMVNLGGGNDVAVLNYAYALEQLEAGFYTSLRDGAYYKGLAANTAEKQVLDDLYYHEVIHREFFKAALGNNAIKALTPDFSQIDFAVRARTGATGKLGVLDAAKAFEDLGVAAYNGAGQFLTSDVNLVLAGKIVSVEARHAALIRDLLTEATFVGNDVVTLTSAHKTAGDTNHSPANSSLERSLTPTEVVTAANAFLAEGSKLDASGIK